MYLRFHFIRFQPIWHSWYSDEILILLLWFLRLAWLRHFVLKVQHLQTAVRLIIVKTAWFMYLRVSNQEHCTLSFLINGYDSYECKNDEWEFTVINIFNINHVENYWLILNFKWVHFKSVKNIYWLVSTIIKFSNHLISSSHAHKWASWQYFGASVSNIFLCTT